MNPIILKPGRKIVKGPKLYTLVCQSCGCIFGTTEPEWHGREEYTPPGGRFHTYIDAPSADCPNCKGGVNHKWLRGGEGKNNSYIQLWRRI